MIVAVLATVWFLCAFVLRTRAQAEIGWVLVLSGIPMLGLITWQAGPLWGFVALAIALLLLRTPLRTVRARARRSIG